MQPGKESFDAPAMAIAPQGAPILRLRFACGVMRRDHFDAHQGEIGVQGVAIVGHVPDKALGKCSQEALLERAFDKLRFMTLTTRNPDGDRKTMAVDHCHDLGRFAASSFANLKTPLFAPAWEPSM